VQLLISSFALGSFSIFFVRNLYVLDVCVVIFIPSIVCACVGVCRCLSGIKGEITD
jgi:NADH:ubiquinone oxidoreductase subunit K